MPGTDVDVNLLPPLVFGDPGEFRELMVALTMTGAKTGSSHQREVYEMTDEPLPEVGSTYAVVDSADFRVAVVEVTAVVETSAADISLELAQHESLTLEAWHAGHHDYWESLTPAIRKYLGDPDWHLTDTEPVIVKIFRVVEPDPAD